MAIKIIASNNRLIITDRDVSGLIFVGEKNIEENDGEDFDIKKHFSTIVKHLCIVGNWCD